MIHIVICGHGSFPSGLVSAARLILGQALLHDVHIIDFLDKETTDDLKRHIETVMETCTKMPTLVLCDLRGGSPFQIMASKYMDRKDVEIVYGMNLAMVLETLMSREQGEDIQTLREHCCSCGREQIGYYKIEQNELNIDDEL